jgi:diguanylate cyclase (GGDEF)-like protein
MMVDDEPITLDAVQAFLEDAGYRRFVLIEDPREVFDKLNERQPDILLLDVVMPQLSGFEVLRRVRQSERFAHLPVIILTSSSDPDTKLRALDLGATDFLAKPVDPSELALRVRNTLAVKAYQDQLAYYDILTNLPNRYLFQTRIDWMIERARREAGKVVLLHLTFNDFNRVSDAFGPQTGDEVLRQLAARLLQSTRAADTVTRTDPAAPSWGNLFRISNAEFTVLLPSLKEIEIAGNVGRRIAEALKAPLDAAGTPVYLTPNIGVAAFPNDADNGSALMKLAAGASAQAANAGGDRICFFSAGANEALVRRLRLEADLRLALERDEFRLVYQPKAEVANDRIVGAEALIRWQRSDGRLVPPLDFIPVAEETGLILPIGDWVIETACRQLAAWQADGYALNVAVNISALQLFESDLVGRVRDSCAAAGVSPSCLTLEVTETLLMDRIEQGIETMQRLRDCGCKLSLDDFGTGYSSLSYLKRFPLDELKIDRSFIVDAVHSREDRALIAAVTFLAHRLGLTVCVEGVEYANQRELIRRAKSDVYQGFLFGRPMSAADLSVRLSA